MENNNNNSPDSRRGAGHLSELLPSIAKRKRTACSCGREDASADDDQPTLGPAAAADEEEAEDGMLSAAKFPEHLLECPICTEPFRCPVYQCVNGHVICSSCVERVHRDCPTCSTKTGHIRCLAIEAVIEAIEVSCSYKGNGCPERITYSSKGAHELTCAYKQCFCPFSGCSFVGTHKSFSPHVNTTHKDSVYGLRFDQICRLSMSLSKGFAVFREEAEGKLFILNEHDRMSISCLDDQPGAAKRYAYDLVVRGTDSSLRFQSLTNRFECSRKGGEIADSAKDFISVPSYLGDHDGCLSIELCIWSSGSPSIC